MTTTDRREPSSRGGSLRAPAAGLIVLLAGALASAGPWGVPLGKRAVKTEIQSGGDVDSYLVEAHAGARLDVKIGVAKRSALNPDAMLIGPDGSTQEAVFEGSGRSLRLRRFTIPASGRYEIRVSGRDGTSGAYSVSAKVKGSPEVGVKGLRVAAGAERTFEFAAGPGAVVSFKVRSRPAAAGFVRIESPSGDRVTIPAGGVRADAGGRLRGKGIELPTDAAFGAWRLVIRADAAALDDVRATITAKHGRLPQIRGKLPAIEPALHRVAPEEAGSDTTLDIHGALLADTKKRSLRVFVGGREAAGVVVVSESLVRAAMPAGLSGMVDVGILNGDGHAVALRDAVLAVPPPRATSFAPQSGPALGGTVVTVRGTAFRPGTAVTVAGTAFPARTEFVDATKLLFTTPAFAGGGQDIGVRDPTGQSSTAVGLFEFVPAPFVLEVRPPLVPRLPGESAALFGGGFTSEQAISIGGLDPASTTLTSPNELRFVVPELPLGAHDVVVTDDLGQTSLTPDGLTVFSFGAGPGLDATGAPPPADMALADFDDDGDLDVFLVSPGGASLADESLLRVLRNDGAEGYTDVTDSVIPEPDGDDWRADTIAFGDVAGDVGTPPPDGYPDIVLGSLDEGALATTRSRVRILANRAAAGGGRVFVDRTDVLMSPPSQYDDWRAEDLWVGDLDGDGGIDDIVATHDELPEGVSPLAPYYVYYLSGTRVFSFATPQGGGYGAFAWQSRRMPNVIGTQIPTQGFPLCINGAYRTTFTHFSGASVAVTDLDGDGRKDIAVTSPSAQTLSAAPAPSTQIARNENILGLDTMVDRTVRLGGLGSALLGDFVLAGDVAGDSAEDLVVVRHPATGSGLAVDIIENRGFDAGWQLRTADLLPAAAGDERLQADAADLVDVDGDGDLDLVLLVVSVPTSGQSASGLGLRILRNRGEQGFSRELEELLPESVDEIWNGTTLATGSGNGGSFDIVIARPDAQGDDTLVRTVERTTEE